MMTVRQIEKRWNAQLPAKLIDDLLASRPEDSSRLRRVLSANPVAVAAMALVRLDELNQSHTPLASRLLRHVLATQGDDGGWDSPAVTAICLRALLLCGGHGLAIDRGMQSLAALQKDDGLWPTLPIRRTESDAFVSAFILFCLGDSPAFRQAVRFAPALDRMTRDLPSLDPETQQLYQRATARCRARLSVFSRLEQPASLWS